jgi:hypothetical protein
MMMCNEARELKVCRRGRQAGAFYSLHVGVTIEHTDLGLRIWALAARNPRSLEHDNYRSCVSYKPSR